MLAGPVRGRDRSGFFVAALADCLKHKKFSLYFFLVAGRVAGLRIILVQHINMSTPYVKKTRHAAGSGRVGSGPG
jgi:hypothetical protein